MHNALRDPAQKDDAVAVCIDARGRELERFPEILLSLDRMDVDCQLVFLDALSPTLVKRFSETRRRHPLTSADRDLRQAIDAESALLESIADLADLTVDTTRLEAAELTGLIRDRLAANDANRLSLLFRSFGFKHGVPVDADYVFDVRCLPNPHWVDELRPLTGLDSAVKDYLGQQPLVQKMFDDISGFLEDWLPHFEENNRMYMTIAVGCTGGQHRSVYLSERLGSQFSDHHLKDRWNVLVRHRELAHNP